MGAGAGGGGSGRLVCKGNSCSECGSFGVLFRGPRGGGSVFCSSFFLHITRAIDLPVARYRALSRFSDTIMAIFLDSDHKLLRTHL